MRLLVRRGVAVEKRVHEIRPGRKLRAGTSIDGVRCVGLGAQAGLPVLLNGKGRERGRDGRRGLVACVAWDLGTEKNQNPHASENRSVGTRLFCLWSSLTHLHADHFAADDDLHAPILFPSGNGIVVGNRVSLAEAFGGDGVCR